jgi:hypothetical protein
MLNTKTLTKLLVITVFCAIPVVLLLSKAGGSAIKSHNELFLPNLIKDPDQISRVIIQDHAQTLTLQRNNNSWQIMEKNDFPVLQDKVEELLFAMAELRIVEPKTANPQLYKQLDVDDFYDDASKAILITVQDQQNSNLAKVIIGKREGLATGEDYIEHIFIRKADDSQTWLVQGLLPLSNDFKDWVEQPLLGVLESDQVKRLVLRKANGDKVIIAKLAPEQEDFVLETMQARPGMTLDVDSVNTLPFEVAQLEFEDVIPAVGQSFDWSNSVVADVESFPGINVALSVLSQDNAVFARINASAAEDAPQAIKDQVASYNQSKAPWVYRLPPDFYKAITVSNPDFLKVAELTTTE